jgi:hypothetical protein
MGIISQMWTPGVDLQVEAPEAPKVDPLVARTRPRDRLGFLSSQGVFDVDDLGGRSDVKIGIS